MATINRPGVYVEESLLSVNLAPTPVTPPQAFAGVHPRGPEAWTEITSWSDFERLYGGFSESASDLAIAAYLYFIQQGGNLFIGRVVGANAVTATTTLSDRDAVPEETLRIDGANSGVWANQIFIEIVDSALDADFFDVNVYYGGTTAGLRVESWQYLSMDSTSDRYAPAIINAGSNYIRVFDEGSTTATPNPALQAPTALAGGTNGDAVVAADTTGKVQQLDTVPGPVVLALPGQTDTAVLTAVINYAEAREDLFVLVDAPANASVTDMVTFSDALPSSSYAATYYPRVYVNDPTTSIQGVERLVPATGLIAGIYSRIDVQRGVFRSPAGAPARITGVTRVERQLTNTELGTLNNAHINAIKPLVGVGVVPYGARTMRKTLQADRYIGVRRTLITVKRDLSNALQFAVFENNDPQLWRQVIATAERYLDNVWQSGGLRGATAAEAYYVKCDDALNPLSAIAQGILNVEVGVSLQRPAEFIVIKLQESAGGVSAIEI